jgi:hypothetical protein
MTKANISWITDQLATGGDLSYNDNVAMIQWKELLDYGLALVIDTREEADDELLWANSEVEYLYLPTNDAHGHTIPTDHFDAAVAAALPVLEGGGKVFIHCHMGVNRGPSTAFAVMLAQGIPGPKAFDMIRAARPQAGLYYAMDALKAHLLRKGIGLHTQEGKRRGRALRDHIDKVMTREIRKSIQHVIRRGHEQDAIDFMASSSAS